MDRQIAPVRFAAPRLPDGYVPRAHLVRRLDEQLDARTVVLAAPAGYGKSSLLAEWAARPGRPYAWVELTREDDEPGRLLARLAAALEWLAADDAQTNGRARGTAARITRRELTSSELLGLAADVGARREHALLVLDDVHHVRSGDALEQIAVLAHSLPPGIGLALTSRSQPQLRLDRTELE
jgi:LuxR family maltose regulon positive regulatory protein